MFLTFWRLSVVWIFCVLPVTFQPSVSAISSDNWITYLHDSQRSGASQEGLLSPTTVSQIQYLGQTPLGGPIAAQAAIVNGVAYLGSWAPAGQANMFAIDIHNGNSLWPKVDLGHTSVP